MRAGVVRRQYPPRCSGWHCAAGSGLPCAHAAPRRTVRVPLSAGDEAQCRNLPARCLTPSLGRAMLQRTTIFCDAIWVPPMRDSNEVLARLRAFRSKFEGLLASSRKRAARACVAPAHRPTRLRELTGFGANPGNLCMFAYAPEHMPPKRPLVIALHGCTQTAD